MNIKKIFKPASFCMLFFSLIFLLRLGGSKDLVASLGSIPGLIDSPDKGAFVDLVKAMDDVYTEGKIKIEVYPYNRSIDNVITGKADFQVPALRNPLIPESKLPYRFTKEKIGTASFVIYSHIDKPITKKMIDNALSKGGKFPYKIDSANIEGYWTFPVTSTNNLSQSLQKVGAKRVDALVWAQEEADLVLRDLKIKTINRALLMTCDDGIIIQKGPEGEKPDSILSDALKKLRASGRLQKLYSKIHLPYNNWQPAKMDW